MISEIDRQEIERFVLTEGGPKALSLSPSTHLFYFHGNDWRESPVILVNKNGNHMRIMREGKSGLWRMCSTWNSLDKAAAWMERDFSNSDPEKLLSMVSIGGASWRQEKSSRQEMLTLFPKDAFHNGPRRVCWRCHIINVRFSVRDNSFTLLGAGGPGPITFDGKPWESSAAAQWCREQDWPVSPAPIMESSFIENPYDRKAANERAVLELQDNPLFGAFG